MQKNSGNKGAKRGGAGDKNLKEVNNLFSFICDNGNLDQGIHISKVIRVFGNRQLEVMYIKKEIETFTSNTDETIEKESLNVYQKHANIRGVFCGRGKRDVPITVGSVVVVQENLNILQVIAVLNREQLRDLSSQIFIDKRILAEGTAESGVIFGDGIEFASDNEDSGTTIVDKKNKHKHERVNIPSADVNIDDI